MTQRLSNAAASAAADAVVDSLDGGYFRIYDGAMPATPDDPPTGTLLVELRWGSPAFSPAVDGTAQGETLYQGEAIADGTATWFRWLTAAQNSVMDGDISDGSTPAALELVPTTLVTGLTVQIAAASFTISRS